jgi:hypothetical protein
VIQAVEGAMRLVKVAKERMTPCHYFLTYGDCTRKNCLQIHGAAATAAAAAAAAAKPAKPAKPAAANAGGGGAAARGKALPRELYVAFYQKHDPASISRVDMLLEKFSEDQLLDAMQQKYGETPADLLAR